MSTSDFSPTSDSRNGAGRLSRNSGRPSVQRILDGHPGTRKWTQEQRAAILRGETPRSADQAIEGHHRYSAKEYPHIANDPDMVTPATKSEHKDRWHGGNYQNTTHGTPRNPDVEEEF